MDKWDVFISHASEDKDAFVRPLALALCNLGVRVWYDEFSLRLYIFRPFWTNLPDLSLRLDAVPGHCFG